MYSFCDIDTTVQAPNYRLTYMYLGLYVRRKQTYLYVVLDKLAIITAYGHSRYTADGFHTTSQVSWASGKLGSTSEGQVGRHGVGVSTPNYAGDCSQECNI